MMGLHAAVERRGPKSFAIGAIYAGPDSTGELAGGSGDGTCSDRLPADRAQGGHPRVAVRILLLATASYALASPWLPPSTLAQTFVNAPLAQASEGTFAPEKMGAAGFVLLAGAVAVAVAASRAWLRTAYARFTLIWLAMLSVIVLGWYWGGITVVPQPYGFISNSNLPC